MSGVIYFLNMRACVVFCLIVAVVGAAPRSHNRIIGGTVTTIDNYPTMAAILDNRFTPVFTHWCGGTILNNRSVLTAAHCSDNALPVNQVIRVGSTFSQSGGVVHTISTIINHPDYGVAAYLDSEVAIMRITGSFVFNNNVQPASIAGPNYVAPDNAVVWAAGWGSTGPGGHSEQLQHVQIYKINFDVCRSRYGADKLTPNMLCAGILDVGGRDQCSGDSGGPLFHNGNVIGITSWGFGCGSPTHPGVNVRVSNFAQWIVNNA